MGCASTPNPVARPILPALKGRLDQWRAEVPQKCQAKIPQPAARGEQPLCVIGAHRAVFALSDPRALELPNNHHPELCRRYLVCSLRLEHILGPLDGSACVVSGTSAAQPSASLRKFTGLVADSTQITAG